MAPTLSVPSLNNVRAQIGLSLFRKVAGPDAIAERDRIHSADGERWFSPDSPIGNVHGDASMYIGGLRALLLQSLHPLAMAGVDDFSGFHGDPWGRLQRTSNFIGTTTFGTIEDAGRAIARVRKVHASINGTAPDGRAYAASDPELLRWVHVAEIDSFLTAHDRYGARSLSAAARDVYVAQTAVVARELGAAEPPTSVAELHELLAYYRPQLSSTASARATARYLLLHPPIGWTMRGPYAGLAAAAVGLLPGWARVPLRLPYLPVAEATIVRASGIAVTSGIRWVMKPITR